MSNSSITSFEVQRNLRLEAARREASLRELKATRERLAHLGERSRAAGIDIDVPAAAADGRLSTERDIQAQLGKLRTLVAEVQHELDRALVARELKAIAEVVRNTVSTQPNRREGASQVQRSLGDRAASAVPALADFDRLFEVAVVPPSMIPEMMELAARARAAKSSAEVMVLLVELRARVASARRSERERISNAKLAQEALDDASGLASAALDACRAQLSAILERRGTLTADLLQATSGAIADARKRADREYVGAVVEEKLRSLGYQVDGQVQTLFIEGGYVHLRRGDADDVERHAIELEVHPDDAKMAAKVVRISDDARPLTLLEQQHSMEQQDKWCRELSELMDAFSQGGIGVSVDELSDPDGAALQIVHSLDVRVTPQRRRRHADPIDRVMEKRRGG